VQPGRQPRAGAADRRESGSPRRRLFHFELEDPRFRVDRLDRACEHDATPMEEP
jgi:hypothetical protein